MGRVILTTIFGLLLAACVSTPKQIAEAEILATWDQFETYYNAGDIEGVKSLLYIEALDNTDRKLLDAEVAAMEASSAWMMSPNVGVKLDADVKVRSVEGDNAVIEGILAQVNGQSVFFSMVLARVDGTWLLAPAGAPKGTQL